MKTLKLVILIISAFHLNLSLSHKLNKQEIIVYENDYSWYQACCIDYPYSFCPYTDYYCVDEIYVSSRKSVPNRKTDSQSKLSALEAAKKELKNLKALLFKDVNFDLEKWRLTHEKEVFSSKALHKEAMITLLAKLTDKYSILKKIQ